jgi:hypothetical protein
LRTGTEFTFVVPVVNGYNEFLVFAYEDASVTIRDRSGTQVTAFNLRRGQYWRTTGIYRARLFDVEHWEWICVGSKLKWS